MLLPAIDAGLMETHLSTHEGKLFKLHTFYHQAEDPHLKELLLLQIKVMKVHVPVMLSFFNPHLNEWIELPMVDELYHDLFSLPHSTDGNHSVDKPIALEAKSTATEMAQENFTSALMMKNENVKHVHVHMALQQYELLKKFEKYLKHKGWAAWHLNASKKGQLETIQKYQHLLQQA
ncbi:hypothetical protein RZN22_04405 [Bacillaceae bacterium S4-13-58]